MNIKFYLMHLDKQVALVDADITVNMLNIKSFEAIDKYRLPVMLRNLENEEYGFEIWWKKRIIPESRREYYNLIRALYNFPFSERPLMKNSMYLISLISHCASLTDKYWFNPTEEYALPFKAFSKGYMKDFLLKPKKFCEVDYFSNKFDTNINKVFTLRNELYTDCLPITPSITTPGNVQKFWDIIDDEFFLMKYLYNIKELKSNEILINNFLQSEYPELANNMYLFNKQATSLDITIENDRQLQFVVSKCFVDSETEFISAEEILYASGSDGDELDLYYDNCDYLGIKDSDLPLEASKAINQEFGIEEDRRFDNFGFIRDAETCVFLRPAPLFGNSYYKYILGKHVW